jgi:hypothetical protein
VRSCGAFDRQRITDSRLCRVSGPRQYKLAAAGKPIEGTWTIQAVAADSKPQRSGGDVFVAHLLGPATVTAKVRAQGFQVWGVRNFLGLV